MYSLSSWCAYWLVGLYIFIYSSSQLSPTSNTRRQDADHPELPCAGFVPHRIRLVVQSPWSDTIWSHAVLKNHQGVDPISVPSAFLCPTWRSETLEQIWGHLEQDHGARNHRRSVVSNYRAWFWTWLCQCQRCCKRSKGQSLKSTTCGADFAGSRGLAQGNIARNQYVCYICFNESNLGIHLQFDPNFGHPKITKIRS